MQAHVRHLLLVSCRENELDPDAEYDVNGGLDLYESRKNKGTKVYSHVSTSLFI